MAEKRNNKEQWEMKDTKKLSSTGSSNGKQQSLFLQSEEI